MRILVWNCGCGLGSPAKLEYLKSFSPDIAVIPEVRKKNIEKINPEDSVWVTNNHKAGSQKGLGVLSFNGYHLEPLQRDEDMELFIPVRVSKAGLSFNLLAVWSFYHHCKQGRFKNVRGTESLEFSVIRHYRYLFTDPCLIAGDWNMGPTLAQGEFLKLMDLVGESGMKSLYHKHYELAHNESDHPTFKMNRKGMHFSHHLDHIFGSKYFYENMSELFIDGFKDEIYSDHASLVLDINTDGPPILGVPDDAFQEDA